MGVESGGAAGGRGATLPAPFSLRLPPPHTPPGSRPSRASPTAGDGRVWARRSSAIHFQG